MEGVACSCFVVYPGCGRWDGQHRWKTKNWMLDELRGSCGQTEDQHSLDKDIQVMSHGREVFYACSN
jgi:hypothetical protein